jgi:glucose/arabinose dehydrogenase
MSRACLRGWTVVCCAALFACDKKAPPAPPSVDPPAAVETINGNERIGWDQIAADSTELAAIRYAIYVDTTRAELTNVSCAAESASGPFSCAAKLPSLTPGAHTLALASFVVDGSVLESAKSASLRVVVSAVVTNAAPPVTIASALHDSLVTTHEGVSFRLKIVADAVDHPVDIAFAPDGRVFVAERGGRVRILTSGGVSSARTEARDRLADNGRLLALAVDPQFGRNHFVYAISIVAAGGRPTFLLARFREVSNTFGDRVVLLDGVPAAAADPSAALRFGPDGSLFIALDDGDDPAVAADLASPRGKILRLNADGSTPADQAGASPMYAFGYHSPRAIAWRAGSDTLWVAERPGTLAAVETDRPRGDRQKRGVTRQVYKLPEPIEPSAMVFFHDDLLVASDKGRSLLLVRFDARNSMAVASTEALLRDRIGPVHVVGVGIDGAIYVGTDDTIARLVPMAGLR